MDSPVLLKVENLKKHYPTRHFFKKNQSVRALDGVSFELHENETLAIVGESGCGKSTLAKVLMQLEPATDGKLEFAGDDVGHLPMDEFRKQVQMIFQDPYGSLNPRKKVSDSIGEPLKIRGEMSSEEIQQRVESLMEKVGLRKELSSRYPHMFSGGQRQRIGIARALSTQPRLLICDEPVSALDVSVQAQVLNLLNELQDEHGLSYIFISHDLSVVRHIAHRVMVMYLGKIVEFGNRENIFMNPQHPYTKALLASTPTLAVSRAEESLDEGALKGELPSPLKPPSGCSFHKRCPVARPECAQEAPELRNLNGRQVACHFAGEGESDLTL